MPPRRGPSLGGMRSERFFRRYLLPGFVFESAVIAGGYATGRELVEFFLPAGPWGGLLGMLVSMLVWSAVLMVSFELARVARAYDYRSFFKLLLGPRLVPVRDRLLPLIVIIMAVMGGGRRRDHATVCSACRNWSARWA